MPFKLTCKTEDIDLVCNLYCGMSELNDNMPCSFVDACKIAGVAFSTFNHWQQWARDHEIMLNDDRYGLTDQEKKDIENDPRFYVLECVKRAKEIRYERIQQQVEECTQVSFAQGLAQKMGNDLDVTSKNLDEQDYRLRARNHATRTAATWLSINPSTRKSFGTHNEFTVNAQGKIFAEIVESILAIPEDKRTDDAIREILAKVSNG